MLNATLRIICKEYLYLSIEIASGNFAAPADCCFFNIGKQWQRDGGDYDAFIMERSRWLSRESRLRGWWWFYSWSSGVAEVVVLSNPFFLNLRVEAPSPAADCICVAWRIDVIIFHHDHYSTDDWLLYEIPLCYQLHVHHFIIQKKLFRWPDQHSCSFPHCFPFPIRRFYLLCCPSLPVDYGII